MREIAGESGGKAVQEQFAGAWLGAVGDSFRRLPQRPGRFLLRLVGIWPADGMEDHRI